MFPPVPEGQFVSWLSTCGKCQHCGCELDDDPYCVQKDVLAARTKETGRTYPFGLDLSKALPLCNGDYFETRIPISEFLKLKFNKEGYGIINVEEDAMTPLNADGNDTTV